MLPLIAATIYFLGSPLPTLPALTAYDCTKGDQHSKNSINHLFPWCESVSKSRTIQADLVERSPLRTVNAYRCLVTFNQLLVDSRGSKRMTLSNHTQIIGREACLKAHNSKSVVLFGQQVPFLDTNGTIEHTLSMIKAEDIEGDRQNSSERTYHYERTYQITLSRQLGDVDFKNDIVMFGEIACDFSQLTCEDENLTGDLHWKSEREGGTINLYRGDIVLVERNETETSPEVVYALIHIFGKIYVLKTLWNETNGEKTEFQTEVDKLYIIQPPQPKMLHSTSIEEKLKNVYCEATGFDAYDEVEVVKRLCKKERTDFLRHFYASATYIEIEVPRKGCRVYKTDDIFDQYRTKKCFGTRVYPRETEECFKDIPVRDGQGEHWFLDPLSRILKFLSTPVECQAKLLSNKTEATSKAELESADVKILRSGAQSEGYGIDLGSTVLKYVGLVLLIVWPTAIVVRVASLIMRCAFCRNLCSDESETVGPDQTEQASFNFCTFLSLFKPPLPENNLFGKGQKVGRLPEPTVKATF